MGERERRNCKRRMTVEEEDGKRVRVGGWSAGIAGDDQSTLELIGI